MSVVVACQCGNKYELKDEFAGKMVKCPNCGTANRAPGTPLERKAQADPVFDRDVFLLRQKVLTINEKYSVSSEDGAEILFVERPAHLLRNLGALFAGVIAATLFAVILSAIAAALTDNGMPGLGAIASVLSIVGAIVVLFVVGVGLSRKRHVSFYRDQAKVEKVLEVLQDKKMEFFTTTFIVRDAKGLGLGRLRKNQFSNIIRKKWRLMNLSGQDILVAKEDSIILSLLRRLLGPLFGLLRTNFVFEDGSGRHVGEFQRKLTILDRYALDMRADPQRHVDRRLALALGVILDTGERR